MRKVFVASMAIALLVTAGAVASVDKIQERAIPADHTNCNHGHAAAPGAVQYSEDFEGGTPPAGWAVIDDAGAGQIWMSNADWGDPNKTNGTGLSAALNSDTFGSGFPLDSSLVTPVFDFCAGTASGLNVSQYYEQLTNDQLDIDVTTDGVTWTNILSWTTDHLTPEDLSLDMSAYDGYPSVQIRWRYWDPDSTAWVWDAQIDNVEITSDGTVVEGVGTCDPPGGDGGGDGGGAVPATSTTGVLILAVLLMIGGSLFVVLRRRTA